MHNKTQDTVCAGMARNQMVSRNDVLSLSIHVRVARCNVRGSCGQRGVAAGAGNASTTQAPAYQQRQRSRHKMIWQPLKRAAAEYAARTAQCAHNNQRAGNGGNANIRPTPKIRHGARTRMYAYGTQRMSRVR